MARPTDTGSFAEAVYAQLEPVATPYDETYDWPLLIFVAAIGQMFQQFDDLAHSDEVDGPWTRLLDVNRIPDEGVPWLGQFYGVQVDTALSVDDQRQQIRDLESWGRGTVAAIKQAILRSGGLTGNRTITIRERDSSAYHFSVITSPNETIGTGTGSYQAIYDDYASYAQVYGDNVSYADLYFSYGERLVYDAILKAKPAGLQFSYSVAYLNDYWSIWGDFPDYQYIYDHFLTYQALYDYNSPAGTSSIGAPFESLYDSLTNYEDVWNANQGYENILENYAQY